MSLVLFAVVTQAVMVFSVLSCTSRKRPPNPVQELQPELVAQGSQTALTPVKSSSQTALTPVKSSSQTTLRTPSQQNSSTTLRTLNQASADSLMVMNYRTTGNMVDEDADSSAEIVIADDGPVNTPIRPSHLSKILKKDEKKSKGSKEKPERRVTFNVDVKPTTKITAKASTSMSMEEGSSVSMSSKRPREKTGLRTRPRDGAVCFVSSAQMPPSSSSVI